MTYPLTGTQALAEVVDDARAHHRARVAQTRARQLDARFWAIINKPVSEETDEDRAYLAEVEARDV